MRVAYLLAEGYNIIKSLYFWLRLTIWADLPIVTLFWLFSDERLHLDLSVQYLLQTQIIPDLLITFESRTGAKLHLSLFGIKRALNHEVFQAFDKLFTLSLLVDGEEDFDKLKELGGVLVRTYEVELIRQLLKAYYVLELR